jgi:hypothetical protein
MILLEYHSTCEQLISCQANCLGSASLPKNPLVHAGSRHSQVTLCHLITFQVTGRVTEIVELSSRYVYSLDQPQRLYNTDDDDARFHLLTAYGMRTHSVRSPYTKSRSLFIRL